jgi:acyl homoserine lactone synthase
MITVLSKDNASHHVSHVVEMHRLRKEVFHDRLGWSVAVSGDLEVDEYDALGPVCILSQNPKGEVLGTVRLLPTTGPYMLRNTFAPLLDGREAPASELIWEASRFAVARGCAKGDAGLSGATYELLIGVLQFGLANDIEAILCVVDLRMERVLRRAGWPMQRLGSERRIGSTTALAGQLDVSTHLLHQLEDLAEDAGFTVGPSTRPQSRPHPSYRGPRPAGPWPAVAPGMVPLASPHPTTTQAL